MKANAVSQINEMPSEAKLWQADSDPLSALTPRERLHQNILRLRALDRRLSSRTPRNQNELLTAIELTGFKIRHLARQIQETAPADFPAPRGTPLQ